MNIVLLGPPASGKGTQSEFLARNYKLYKFVMSEQLKNYKGKIDINAILQRGELVGDDIIFDVISSKIKPKQTNIIFDGIPRNVEQAAFLNQLVDIDFAILLEISDFNALFERIQGRLVCSKCHLPCEISSEKQYVATNVSDKVCQKCGGKLIKRSDDNLETIFKRIEIYNSKIKKVLDYYENCNKLYVVDASQSISEVSESIVKVIDG